MRLVHNLHSLLPAVGLILVAACTDSPSPTSPGVAAAVYSQGSGSGGGSGGGSVVLPDVSGVWRGTYTWQVAAFGTLPSPATNALLAFINEDASGNLWGRACPGGADNPGCGGLVGKVQSNGAVQLDFGTGGGSSFRFNGFVGTATCADGSIATSMTGTFRAREGSGTFALDRCPT